MNDKRLIFAMVPLALLAACGEEPADDGRAASGEVLEGTVSDAMLPLDRVQSEPPLEDPEAFAEAQEEAAEATGDEGADQSVSEEPAVEADETSETAVAPPPEPPE